MQLVLCGRGYAACAFNFGMLYELQQKLLLGSVHTIVAEHANCLSAVLVHRALDRLCAPDFEWDDFHQLLERPMLRLFQRSLSAQHLESWLWSERVLERPRVRHGRRGCTLVFVHGHEDTLPLEWTVDEDGMVTLPLLLQVLGMGVSRSPERTSASQMAYTTGLWYSAYHSVCGSSAAFPLLLAYPEPPHRSPSTLQAPRSSASSSPRSKKSPSPPSPRSKSSGSSTCCTCESEHHVHSVLALIRAVKHTRATLLLTSFPHRRLQALCRTTKKQHDKDKAHVNVAHTATLLPGQPDTAQTDEATDDHPDAAPDPLEPIRQWAADERSTLEMLLRRLDSGELATASAVALMRLGYMRAADLSWPVAAVAKGTEAPMVDGVVDAKEPDDASSSVDVDGVVDAELDSAPPRQVLVDLDPPPTLQAQRPSVWDRLFACLDKCLTCG